jgi:hypothetical protein
VRNLIFLSKRKFFDVFVKPVLPVCFIVLVLASCNNSGNGVSNISDSSKGDTSKRDTPIIENDTTILTVWYVKDSSAFDTLKVFFYESERIYLLLRSAENFTQKNDRLKEATGKLMPLKIIFDEHSGLIRNIDSVTKAESDSFLRRYKKIYPSVKIVPCPTPAVDMTKANEIFKYCADQQCPTPASITPCIPFQYVIDGCYARAHKMRDIVETKYKICVRKVFSYANPPTSELAVRASKWGGCCVTWAWHVAPVIKVKTASGDADYVIDPGMFNNVVTVAVWLDAQKTKACSPIANVFMSSIQPGEYYTPAPGGGYINDPTLKLTDGVLRDYKDKKTCPPFH